MIFIPDSCNIIPRFLCGGMVPLVAFPLPFSASQSKLFRLSSPSGPQSSLSSYHSFYRSLFPCSKPSRINIFLPLWHMTFWLVTCFQGGPLPLPYSRRLDISQFAKAVTLLETWSSVIIWRFHRASCSSFKSFLLLLLASGLLSFRNGCLTMLRTFARPDRNKVSYAQDPRSLPLHPSCLGLLVLIASSAQELRKSYFQRTYSSLAYIYDFRYSALLWFFPIGFLAPIPFYLLARRFPLSIWRYINVPALFGILAYMPQLSGINYSSGILWGFIFNCIIRRFRSKWWMRYNYIVASALNAGTTISMAVMFFTLTIPKRGGIELHWWGNTWVPDRTLRL